MMTIRKQRGIPSSVTQVKSDRWNIIDKEIAQTLEEKFKLIRD